MFGAQPDWSGMLRSELRWTVGRGCRINDQLECSQPESVCSTFHSRFLTTSILCRWITWRDRSWFGLDVEPGHGLLKRKQTRKGRRTSSRHLPPQDLVSNAKARWHEVGPSCNVRNCQAPNLHSWHSLILLAATCNDNLNKMSQSLFALVQHNCFEAIKGPHDNNDTIQ